jgi:uncharacterized membrane protein
MKPKVQIQLIKAIARVVATILAAIGVWLMTRCEQEQENILVLDDDLAEKGIPDSWDGGISYVQPDDPHFYVPPMAMVSILAGVGYITRGEWWPGL